MITKIASALIAALVAATVASSAASAQPHRQRGDASQTITRGHDAYGSTSSFNPNSPAAAGGGSFGYNQQLLDY